MSLIYVDLRSRTPIFEQIIECVRDLVIRGLLSPDEHLPSVRALAAELAINPNTIQKAYGELERQGVIYSLAGRGKFCRFGYFCADREISCETAGTYCGEH